MPGQPQRRHADHRRDQHGDEGADRGAGDGRQAEVGVDGDGRIGARAEEDGMADRHLAGIAADQVPRRGADGGQQHERAEPLVDRQARRQQRIGQGERADDAGKEIAPHHALPIRPCGRVHSTSTNSA